MCATLPAFLHLSPYFNVQFHLFSQKFLVLVKRLVHAFLTLILKNSKNLNLSFAILASLDRHIVRYKILILSIIVRIRVHILKALSYWDTSQWTHKILKIENSILMKPKRYTKKICTTSQNLSDILPFHAKTFLCSKTLRSLQEVWIFSLFSLISYNVFNAACQTLSYHSLFTQ